MKKRAIVLSAILVLVLFISMFAAGCREEKKIERTCTTTQQISCSTNAQPTTPNEISCKTDDDCTRNKLEKACMKGIEHQSCLDESFFCENELCKSGCRCKIKETPA